MANAEQTIANDPGKFGKVWFPPVSLKALIEQDRVRLAGTDNGLVLEVDGEAWSIPEAYRLSFFE